MLTMLEILLLVDHIQVSSSSCRKLRLFVSQRGITRLKRQYLRVSLSHYVYVRSWLLRCATSYACLGFRWIDQQMSVVTNVK